MKLAGRIVFFVLLFWGGMDSLFAQNFNDPYNMQGNPQNPNNLPQAQYGTSQNAAADTTSEDTTKTEREKYGLKHNPRIASLASVILPGAGQIYNGKMWKVPIFWGLMGTFGYLVISNNRRYQDFRDAFVYQNLRDPNDFSQKLTREEAESRYNLIYGKYENEILPFDTIPLSRSWNLLENRRDEARRVRDWMAVFCILTYVCNIMDAAVDAHFAKFDVSDKLSMRVKPELINPVGVPQLGLNLNFAFIDTREKQKFRILNTEH